MRDSIVLFFSLVSVMLCGVFISSLAYIRDEKSLSLQSRLWITSILLVILGLSVFAYGTATTPEAMKSNSVAFSFANTFYLGGIVFQALFCKSLRTSVSKNTIIYACIGLLIFGAHFEYLRGVGNFTGRVIEVAFLTLLFLVLQILDLIKIVRINHSIQLRLLLVFTICEVILVVSRVVVAATQVNPVLTIEAIPFSLLAIVVFGAGFNVLSYLTMVGFWSENAISRKKLLQSENQKIQHLLKERETMIGSLMASNKSAITGALSASLAHELNQPIGASRINLFSMRKILKDKGEKDSVLESVVTHLELDNQRAGNIVSALRAMFSQQPLESQVIKLAGIVSQVSSLIKGECVANQIELHINVPAHLMVKTSSVELQQVLLNLLNNAIQALKTSANFPKEIWIVTSPSKDGFIDLCIEDNGPGVSPEIASNLFDLFTSKGSGGMGVGLWLCKYIMEYCGGFIRYSPRSGGGSKFCASIPIA